MRLLIDTHVLIWLAVMPLRVGRAAMMLLDEPDNTLSFSAAASWEISIKRALGRSDFDVDPDDLTKTLIDNGWAELAITGRHGIVAGALPRLHADPFDRVMIAQARSESMTFLTADSRLIAYGEPVKLV